MSSQAVTPTYEAGKRAFASRMRGEVFASPYGHAERSLWMNGWNDARDEFLKDTALLFESPPPDSTLLGDVTGYTKVPDRYAQESGRETIDQIRDLAGAWLRRALIAGCNVEDAAFAVHCMSTAYKYRSRLGKKDSVEQDTAKAEWYEAMFKHVLGQGGDPRSYRANFKSYERQEHVTGTNDRGSGGFGDPTP